MVQFAAPCIVCGISCKLLGNYRYVVGWVLFESGFAVNYVANFDDNILVFSINAMY
jgi:hypothetical protein